MKIAAILPHIGKFGGCRRYLELGNCFIKRGIDFTIYAKKQNCDWFDFRGKIEPWNNIKADYILCGDPPSFGILPEARGKIFIYVQAGGGYIKGSNWAKGGYISVYGKYPFIANNRVFLKYFPKSYLVEGGVNTQFFRPNSSAPQSDKPRVLFYNRQAKGADYIKNELADLDSIKLVGFQGLNNDSLLRLYQSGDFFVSWESREGWPNTAAEAIACGLTVVTNGFNCQPFREKVITVKSLRQFFEDRDNLRVRKQGSMEKFSWERNADKLLGIFGKATREKPKKHQHKEHIHKHKK